MLLSRPVGRGRYFISLQRAEIWNNVSFQKPLYLSFSLSLSYFSPLLSLFWGLCFKLLNILIILLKCYRLAGRGHSKVLLVGFERWWCACRDGNNYVLKWLLCRPCLSERHFSSIFAVFMCVRAVNIHHTHYTVSGLWPVSLSVKHLLYFFTNTIVSFCQSESFIVAAGLRLLKTLAKRAVIPLTVNQYRNSCKYPPPTLLLSLIVTEPFLLLGSPGGLNLSIVWCWFKKEKDFNQCRGLNREPIRFTLLLAGLPAVTVLELPRILRGDNQISFSGYTHMQTSVIMGAGWRP